MPKKSTQKRVTERGKVAINFEVDLQIHEHLRIIADQEERSIAAVIRLMVIRALAERGILIEKKTSASI